MVYMNLKPFSGSFRPFGKGSFSGSLLGLFKASFKGSVKDPYVVWDTKPDSPCKIGAERNLKSGILELIGFRGFRAVDVAGVSEI